MAIKDWTNEEIELLIQLYPTHSDKELQKILNKSPNSLRSMKSRLKLNSKQNSFTVKEKIIIEDYYKNTDYKTFSLDELSKMINRQKTSISRYARTIGLTDIRRKPSSKTVESVKNSNHKLMNSKQGDEIRRRISYSLKEYHKTHEHPRGMLGKHHSGKTCKQLSKSHIEYFANLSDDVKHERAMKSAKTRALKGNGATTTNAYSNCKQGFRDDVGCFFRSTWEANFARILNYCEIKWKYECKRFVFPYSAGGVLSYQPDFYLPEYDLWIEIKGWMDYRSKLRLKMFEGFYPNYIDKFVLIDENFYYFLIDQFKDRMNNLEKIEQFKKYKNMEWAYRFIS